MTLMRLMPRDENGIPRALRGHGEAILNAARHVYMALHRKGHRWEPSTFSTHIRAVVIDMHPEYWIAWTRAQRQRALFYICSRAADEDLPYLQDEYAEVYEAVHARDCDRYSAAIRSLVKAGFVALRREGRLIPGTVLSSAGAPERDGDPGSSSAA